MNLGSVEGLLQALAMVHILEFLEERPLRRTVKNSSRLK